MNLIGRGSFKWEKGRWSRMIHVSFDLFKRRERTQQINKLSLHFTRSSKGMMSVFAGNSDNALNEAKHLLNQKSSEELARLMTNEDELNRLVNNLNEVKRIERYRFSIEQISFRF